MHADGSRYWAETVITALRGDDGRLLGFGDATRDVTDRHRGEVALRESEERFRLLVESVADYAIFLLTTDGRVASWNRGAQRLKGYPPHEILGQSFERFYTEDDRRQGVPSIALEQAAATGRWESEGWRVRRDGSRFWARVVLTALRTADGEHHGFAKVTQDLSDRKRNEDALRGVLERERTTAARLAELDRMRTELVAVIAHDLRAPVGVVQQLLELARQDWDELPAGEGRALLDRVAHRVDDLARLVDDVFDVARIDAGELPVDDEVFDLGDVVARLVEDSEVTDPGRALDARIDRPALARGDARRCRQVATNLLSNALRHSPPDRPVSVVVDATGPEVVVTVTDRGPGVPRDQQERIFDRFARLENGASGGTGLGLFIARSLVQAQGGRIWVESAPGSGATFGFSIPAAEPDP